MLLPHSRRELREIEAKTALVKSRIYGVDYAINPYVGCEHGCVYCYARLSARRIGETRDWGSFLYVKRELTKLLARDLRKAKRGLCLLSSITDPYQPVEAELKLTRSILELLAGKMDVVVLTKSPLVLRDLDLISSQGWQAGLTITTLDDSIARVFEPKAPPPSKRIRALREIAKKTAGFMFIGPVLPEVTERDLEQLLEEASSARASYVLVDKLNIKAGNWSSIKRALERHEPKLIPAFKKALFEDKPYYHRIKQRVIELSRKHGVEVEFCY